MPGLIVIGLVLHIHGARIVGMFVIVRIMLFVTALMEHVLALLGISVKSKSNRIIFYTKKCQKKEYTFVKTKNVT